MKTVISPAPHIRSAVTTSRIMFSVFLALIPAGIWGVFRFGIKSFYIILTSVISCMVTEFISRRFIFKKKVTLCDGSAALTGLLMAYCLSPEIRIWQVCVGAFFAIFITKECFGGLGFNIFNPALIGRAVLLASFPTNMTSWQIDGITSATPLAVIKEKLPDILPSYMDIIVGNIPGSIGEVSKVLLICGAAYLLFKKIISWHIPFSFIFSVGVLSVFFGRDPLFEIFSGGVILGAFFMATDYVTCPIFVPGRLIFGLGCGFFTVIIRNFGSYPEGVCYAILIMNALSPLIDKYTAPRVFGTNKRLYERYC
ncbi:MAG: Electron transport complex protein RnfD [Elusimicrobia bacterium ADurb.Bin231]|nr:MAG: Electron transport complex protein RnfD [Elusimicrobia bacterium ADurb.Bin231]